MNRVYPLREGSGECNALIGLDEGLPAEFHVGFKKISL